MASKGFSVVVPTYTGKDQISNCLKSILDQDEQADNYEVIVISDGSKDAFKQAELMIPKFEEKNIAFKPILLRQNIGRFETRMAGAENAKYPQLLFIDERVRLDKGFFGYLGKTDESAIMPNVIELETSNIISMTLNLLRQRAYGAKWGAKHTDYYLGTENFESSPKGTTSLYIDKKVFLNACREVKEDLKKTYSNHISDDTKVLERIIKNGKRIFRPGNLTVYYSPRNSFREAWIHLFWRGPKFLDYYHSPGTRFFPLLVSIYLSAITFVTLAIFSPIWLLYFLLAFVIFIILSSALMAKNVGQFFTALIGLPLTMLTFSAGVLTGTALKIARR
jgi:glycosyltransferase involved in cell wall biosynthesis